MKHVPNKFEVIFKPNPKGGRPIASYNGVIVMPERSYRFDPPLNERIAVRANALPNGRSGVIYVLPAKE